LLLAHLRHALRHRLGVVGIHLLLVLLRHLLHDLLPLLLGHPLEVLLVDLLLHLGRRVLSELLHVSRGLVGVDPTIITGIAGLGVLLVRLLVVLIERVHGALLSRGLVLWYRPDSRSREPGRTHL